MSTTDAPETFEFNGVTYHASVWLRNADYTPGMYALAEVRDYCRIHGSIDHATTWQIFKSHGYKAFPSGTFDENDHMGLIWRPEGTTAETPGVRYRISVIGHAHLWYWKRYRQAPI